MSSIISYPFWKKSYNLLFSPYTFISILSKLKYCVSSIYIDAIEPKWHMAESISQFVCLFIFFFLILTVVMTDKLLLKPLYS